MTRMSDFSLDTMLKQKDGGDKEDRVIRVKQMGKKMKTVTTCCVLRVPVVCSPAGCQVLRTVCILLFPPVQVASHGEPH